MIDLKLLDRDPENPQSYYARYKQCLVNRGESPAVLQQIVELNLQRKKAITEFETLRAEQNKISAEIGKLKKEGKDASEILRQVDAIKQKLKSLEELAAKAEHTTSSLAATLPNMVHESVPVGSSEAQNKIIKSWGEPRKFGFKALEHFDLGEKLNILDFERAGKVTGARFTFLKGAGARLERALISFFLDTHTTQNGYTEMVPPYMVNSAAYFGTGQFPKFNDQVFHIQDTDYHLISTAEVPVTNYYANEILPEDELPKSFAAFSPCFRSEAGASGKDTRGLIRQHQFHKVELMTFCHPQESYERHEQLTSHAENLLQALELPYHRTLLCTGDISFGAAKCYDLEVWLPGSALYREISSCSNFEDFQARRAQIRFRPKGGGKPEFVHTLNGSGLAVGRTLIAVIENYQREDGSIEIPKVLHKYMGGMTEIKS